MNDLGKGGYGETGEERSSRMEREGAAGETYFLWEKMIGSGSLVVNPRFSLGQVSLFPEIDPGSDFSKSFSLKLQGQIL